MTAALSSTSRTSVGTWVNGTAGKRKQKNHRATRLGVQSGGTGARAYLYFAFGAPIGAKLLASLPNKLRLYTDGSWGGASTSVTVKLISAKSDPFSKTDDTNRPTASGSGVTVTKSSSGDGDLWEFPMDTLLQPVADGTPWYGFEITTTSSTRRFFRSSNVGAKRPELLLSWADEPSQPTSLSPSGGQAVSVAKPKLEMDYTDPTGGILSNAQALVSAVEAMTSPFDTGTVPVPAGSKARINLADTAYAGLAVAGEAWWQGRVMDEAGVWSAYSNPTKMVRYDKGALVIDSPGVGGTVTDFTPTIVATYTPPALPSGVGLEKARVTVERISNGNVVYDSEEFPASGTTISVEVEARNGDAVLQRGVAYRLTVYALDTVDRVDTNADPAAIIATRDFEVTNGPATAPTNLEARYVNNPPGIVLDFELADAPDSLTFTVDGVPVEVGVEAAEAHVAGTSYSYTVTRFRPNVAQSFGVTAVDDTNGASTTPEVTYTPRVVGAWLIDKDRGRWLFIAKTGGATYDHGEDSTVHTALGASSGVRITQRLGGLTGSVGGVLVGLPDLGRSVVDWYDEAMAMRAEPGKERVFMVGSESFLCTVGYLNPRITGDSSPNLRPISFDFEQTSAQRIEVAL